MSDNGVPSSRWKRDTCYRTNGFPRSWSRRPRSIRPRQMVWIYTPGKTKSKTHGDYCVSGMSWVSIFSSLGEFVPKGIRTSTHLEALSTKSPSPVPYRPSEYGLKTSRIWPRSGSDAGRQFNNLIGYPFSDFIESCGLNDLHSEDPAPSTYIGSADRRIDFILGCDLVLEHLSRSGTLSYS
jgi:hypothetical protein